MRSELSLVKQNCHDHCKLTTLHSNCFEAAPLKVPIMGQMLRKLETLPFKRQNQKRFGQYANIEKILKSN